MPIRETLVGGGGQVCEVRWKCEKLEAEGGIHKSVPALGTSYRKVGNMSRLTRFQLVLGPVVHKCVQQLQLCWALRR